jgi:hypothetical protein
VAGSSLAGISKVVLLLTKVGKHTNLRRTNMTVAIWSNEHDLLAVYDDRLPQRWFSYPDTPAGEYISIAAAFVGDPLEVVYLQETESKKVLVADPKWMGVLPHLGIGINIYDQAGILSEYPDFVSPYAGLIKLAASDFIQESRSPDFNIEIFILKAWVKYSLEPCQVKTAIRYAKKIDEGCINEVEFFLKIDSIYEKVRNTETFTLTRELERINNEMNSSALAAKNLISKTSQIEDDLEEMMGEFLEGLNID